MILEQDNYHLAYSQIKESYGRGDFHTLHIFVSYPDVDALCATNILTSLLVSDYISFKIILVGGYSDLEREVELCLRSARPDETTLSITRQLFFIFVNCGGTIDLTKFIDSIILRQYSDREGHNQTDYVALVVDSHRPMNLHNLFQSQNICVFDDGDVIDLEKEKNAFLLLNPDDQNNDEEDDESEEENGDESSSVHSNETMDGSQDNHTRQREREFSSRPRKLSHSERGVLQRTINEYYELDWYGNSASFLCFQLSHQLNKANNRLLWFSIVGTSYQMLFNLIPSEQYLELVDFYRDQASRFNSNEELASSEDFSIIYREAELRLPLYRHWSLYQSMLHSSYVASVLGIWRERGKQKLRNLLTKMGFSIRDYSENFTDMDISLQKVVFERLLEAGVSFGLDDLTIPCFSKKFGLRDTISSFDASFALSALLESAGSMSDAFYKASDALQSYQQLMKGLNLCQDIQKKIIRYGTAIIDEKMVKTLKNFRLVVLKEGFSVSDSFSTSQLQFSSLDSESSGELSLIRLGHFLLDAMKYTRKSELPLVIASPIQEHDYLIAGLVTDRRSKFGVSFRKTLDLVGGTLKADRFHASVIRISKSDLARFMENLQIFC